MNRSRHHETTFKREDCFHIFSYNVIRLSTLGRGEVTIDLNADRQSKGGLIKR